MSGGDGKFDHEVLVVGAGPVGLALGVELGLRGIRALVIEQNDRIGRQPRAKTTNVRSMEHMRRWGIAEDVRALAPLPRDYPTNVIFRTRLFGEPLARIENAFRGDRTARDDHFSEAAQWIPQYKIEAVLRRRAESFATIKVRLGQRLEHLHEESEGLTATILDRAREERSTIRVRYVVGADGARGVVRKMIGAEMQGRHAMAQHVNLVVRAPGLLDQTRIDPGIFYWLINNEAAAVASPMDTGDLWAFGYSIGADDKVDDAESYRRMRAAFGRPVDAEIVSTDPWSAHSLIASHYARGRIFLAGDACHLHPPYGGYGMNLGIADAVDLGWKLAAVLRGWGGPRLLESYEAERRPVHRHVIDEAVANHAVLPHNLVTDDLERPGAAGEAARRALGERILVEKRREFHTLGVVLGTHYSGSPIVVPDGTAPPPDDTATYTPSAHPGCLAPHRWLDDGRSLYDLFGTGFSLVVTTRGADEDVSRIENAARARKIPLTVVDPAARDLADLYGARMALVRPDQYVAWRGDEARDAGAILDKVIGFQA